MKLFPDSISFGTAYFAIFFFAYSMSSALSSSDGSTPFFSMMNAFTRCCLIGSGTPMTQLM